jgi:homoserine O-acetyltransferase
VRPGATIGALLLLACAPSRQVALLGDFPLENGEVIRDCRITYRTFGRLDAARSNAVLLVPWAMGTSRQLAAQVGPGKLVDSSRFFVIAVDAFGNGVASSPSNSSLQKGAAFPRFTIRDLVESQRRLLTQVLGINHLAAVVGISAGGMQVFQWVTAHPELADLAVAIAASPRSTAEERERWISATTELQAASRWKRAGAALRRFQPREAVRQLTVEVQDFDRQARAIAGLDVGASFGGSVAAAAAAVRAKMLVVVSERDEVVDPGPALEFARLAGAEVFQLDGRCGHLATSCEKEKMWEVVGRFLGRRN